MKYLLSGISDLVLAGLFIVTWVDPLRFSDTLVKSLMLVMLMEFFAMTRHRLFKSGDNQPQTVTVAGKSHSLPGKPPTN